MALLKYFKLKKFPLPDQEGPLSAHVSTKGANEEVSSILNDDQSNKHSSYFKATPEQKAVLGRYAAEIRIVNSITLVTNSSGSSGSSFIVQLVSSIATCGGRSHVSTGHPSLYEIVMLSYTPDRETFPVKEVSSCNHESFPPRKFCRIRYSLHNHIYRCLLTRVSIW